MISHSAFLLGYPDSNQERQDQNLQCYHYTISQFVLQTNKIPCFLFASAKVQHFSVSCKKIEKNFQKKSCFVSFARKSKKKCKFWEFWRGMSRILSNFALAKWKRAPAL